MLARFREAGAEERKRVVEIVVEEGKGFMEGEWSEAQSAGSNHGGFWRKQPRLHPPYAFVN